MKKNVKFFQMMTWMLALMFAIAACEVPKDDDDDDDGDSAQPSSAEVAKQMVESIKIENLLTHTTGLSDAARWDATNSAYNRLINTPGFQLSKDYVVSEMEKAGYTVTKQDFNYPTWSVNESGTSMSITIDGATTSNYALDLSNDGNDGDFSIYANSGDKGSPITAEVVLVTPNFNFADPNYVSSDACEASDFNGIDVTGKIALIQRGSCAFNTKYANTSAAGAAAMIVFNEGNTDARKGLRFANISPPGGDPASNITMYDIGYDLGKSWADAILANKTVTATLTIDVVEVPNILQNIVAESKGGNPDQILMFGAHLDSVVQGPGVNDNGSGSAGILEFAKQFAKSGITPVNKLRFAWWAAEEQGIIGSTAWADQQWKATRDRFDYDQGIAQGLNLGTFEEWVFNGSDSSGLDTAHRAAADAQFEPTKKVKMYLNFDMIASPNYMLGLYDGDISDTYYNGDTDDSYVGENRIPPPHGTSEIEKVFKEGFFEANGHTTVASALSNRSDYQQFVVYGVAYGGLFTGADGVKSDGTTVDCSTVVDSTRDTDTTNELEKAECLRNNVDEVKLYGGTAGITYDPCYHAACDTVNNLNETAFLINSKAIAHVGGYYAMKEQLFTPKAERNATAYVPSQSERAERIKPAPDAGHRHRYGPAHNHNNDEK